MFGHNSAYIEGMLEAQKDAEKSLPAMPSKELSDLVDGIDSKTKDAARLEIAKNRIYAAAMISTQMISWLMTDSNIYSVALVPFAILKGIETMKKFGYLKEYQRLVKQEYRVRAVSGGLWPIVAKNID